ncbi:calphotin-like isoform X2 [Frankliniella occidentalis]|uniref:Calphotin-like isoform X2 n=1 Tax=Frankliniella occidentalis TaxID=133901 RepID=A0A9C6X8W0_FRAOC|nr:calphotin-like isoform X2 [Frankliniella occidentalis]
MAVLCEDILVAAPSGHHLLKIYVVVAPAPHHSPAAGCSRRRPLPLTPQPGPQPQPQPRPPHPHKQHQPKRSQGHKMTSTALLLLAAIAALCLGDDALREGQPNALTDDIDPELLKLIADGGDMGIDMADRDGRSLATASRLYRELKKKELLKTPTVQKPLTLEERRQKVKERVEKVRKMMKDNRERRLKGLPPVQIEIHGDPLSGKVGTGRSAAKEGENVEDKSSKASDKEAKEQINPEASDKASQTGDNPNETSEAAKKTKSDKSTENETLKTNEDDVGVSGLEKDVPKGDILPKDSVTSQPSTLVTSPSMEEYTSTTPTLHAETSSSSTQGSTTAEATSTTPSPLELSPVAPPPNPVSTASTIFPTISDKESHARDQDQSSSTPSSQEPLETSTAPAIAHVNVQPSASPAPGVMHEPVQPIASPAPAVLQVPTQPIASPAPTVVPMHALQSASPAPVVIHVAAQPASPAPHFVQAPAQPIASPPPSVVQVPVRPVSSPAPAVAPVHPGANPAVWPAVLTPAHHAVQADPRANSWYEYGHGRAASPEQTEVDFQAWAAFEAAVAQERAAQEAVAAQRRAAELMAAQQRAAQQEEAAKQRALQEAQETQRRAAVLLAAQERAERQGAELLAAQQRAIQEVMVAKQRAVELAAAQERAAREEAERMEAQQRAAQEAMAAQEAAVKEAAAALLAEQQRAEREEKAAQQRAEQRAALQDAIAQQQRAAQEAIVAQQIAQKLVTDQDPAPPVPDGPIVLGPPNPAITAPRIVDDLPNGDLENQREVDFQKWKAGLPRYRKPDSYLTPLPDGTLPPSPYTAPGTSGLPTLDEFQRIMEEARGHAVSKRDTTPTDTPSTTTPRHVEPRAPAPLWPRDPYMSSSTAAPARHRDHRHHHDDGHVSVPGAAAPEVPHTHNPYWPAEPNPEEKPVHKKFRPTTAARPFQNATNDGELQPPQGGAPSSTAAPGRPINQGPVIAMLLTSTTARPEPLPNPLPLTVAVPKARPSGSRRKRHLWRGLQEPRDAQCALFGG